MTSVWTTPIEDSEFRTSVRRDGKNTLVIFTQNPLSDSQATELFWCVSAMQRSGKTLNELIQDSKKEADKNEQKVV